MTPQEALQLIDQACALLTLNREFHVKIQEAIEVLRKEISGKKSDK